MSYIVTPEELWLAILAVNQTKTALRISRSNVIFLGIRTSEQQSERRWMLEPRYIWMTGEKGKALLEHVSISQLGQSFQHVCLGKL